MIDTSRTAIQDETSPNLALLQEIISERIPTFEAEDITTRLSLIHDLQLDLERDLPTLVKKINHRFKIMLELDELMEEYERTENLKVGDILEAIDVETELG